MYPRHSDMCCRMPQVQECGLQVTERQAPRLHTLFAAACEAVGLESARFPPPPSAGAAGGGGGKGPRLFVLSSPETAVYCTRMPAEEISLPGHQQHDLPRSQQPQPSAAGSQAGGLAAGSAHASDLPGAVMTEAAVRRSTLAQLTDTIASSQYCCLSFWCTISDVPHADVMTHLVFKDGLKLQHQFFLLRSTRPPHGSYFPIAVPAPKVFWALTSGSHPKQGAAGVQGDSSGGIQLDRSRWRAAPLRSGSPGPGPHTHPACIQLLRYPLGLPSEACKSEETDAYTRATCHSRRGACVAEG